MADDELLYSVTDGIARVTFNRPQARNALTFAMYDRLTEICAQISDDRSIRVLLMMGTGGKAFAAGTDISQFRAFDKEEDAIAYEQRIDRVMDAVERCNAPTIAAISGACTGGGAAIAAACDLRIADRKLRFGFPVARTLGNCLSMSNYARLASLLGAARVKDIVFTARLIEAEEARAIGLVSEVVEPEALAARADELARLVASNAPLTLRATKQALLRLRGRMSPDEGRDLILMCYMSRDFREGMEAFLNKRTPVWRGE